MSKRRQSLMFDKYDVLDYFLDLHEEYVKGAYELELQAVDSDTTENYSYSYSVEKNNQNIDVIRHAIKIIAEQEQE